MTAGRRPLHKIGHPSCQFPSWAVCDERHKEAFGRCTALTEKGNECTKWATDDFNRRRYCNQHAQAIVEAEVRAHRTEKRQAELDRRISEYLDWTAVHPSVWDPRLGNDGAGGESNPSSPEIATGRAKPGSPAGPTEPLGPKDRSVLWSAASGQAPKR